MWFAMELSCAGVASSTLSRAWVAAAVGSSAHPTRALCCIVLERGAQISLPVEAQMTGSSRTRVQPKSATMDKISELALRSCMLQETTATHVLKATPKSGTHCPGHQRKRHLDRACVGHLPVISSTTVQKTRRGAILTGVSTPVLIGLRNGDSAARWHSPCIAGSA